MYITNQNKNIYINIIIIFIYYNNAKLVGIISKLYNIHGTSIINATTIGNKTVQQ